ncbi:MAG: hypothetical protein ACJ8CB_13425, partial [Ktedonobacteraceae bacterium]
MSVLCLRGLQGQGCYPVRGQRSSPQKSHAHPLAPGLLQEREEAGFKGAAAPLRGPGGVPPSLFSSAPAGRKETLQQP